MQKRTAASKPKPVTPARDSRLEELAAENEELRARLAEAEETLRAIQSGEVDAVVVSGPSGQQVFTLEATETERKFHELADSIPNLAWMANPDGFIFWYNRRWYEYTGTSPADMEGWGWQSVHDPDELPDVMRRWKEAIRTGEPFEMTFPLRGADGVFRPFLTRITPLKDANGKVLRWFGTNTDISELKQIEQALRESELRQKLAYIAAHAGTWEWDVLTGACIWSEELWELFGIPQGSCEPSYKVWLNTVHPEDRSAVEQTLKEAVADQKDLVIEWRAVTPDGDIRWLMSRGQPQRDAKGRVNRYIGFSMDITERKMTETALLRSEKLASVGRMAASIAHEINNPLAAVTNVIFLARSVDALPNAALKYLETADEELRRVSHIARQALGFSRETSTPTTATVGSIFDSALDVLQSKIKARNATITRQYGGNLKVAAVTGELRQVLANLLLNSLDAIDQNGAIALRARVARSSINGARMVRITVADNGRGIDPGLRDRVFEPLFTTKGSIGTGLGLWVTRQLVERNGGSIRFWSSTHPQRRGTVFSILLPAGSD